jgi:3-hydroxyisobutyrate dehydrogenase-like beta-hydroxyacid dehydrogenase
MNRPGTHRIDGERHVPAGGCTPPSAADSFAQSPGRVLDMARAKRLTLPLAATAHPMLTRAGSAGHGHDAAAAVMEVFPGVALPEKTA